MWTSTPTTNSPEQSLKPKSAPIPARLLTPGNKETFNTSCVHFMHYEHISKVIRTKNALLAQPQLMPPSNIDQATTTHGIDSWTFGPQYEPAPGL